MDGSISALYPVPGLSLEVAEGREGMLFPTRPQHPNGAALWVDPPCPWELPQLCGITRANTVCSKCVVSWYLEVLLSIFSNFTLRTISSYSDSVVIIGTI